MSDEKPVLAQNEYDTDLVQLYAIMAILESEEAEIRGLEKLIEIVEI